MNARAATSNRRRRGNVTRPYPMIFCLGLFRGDVDSILMRMLALQSTMSPNPESGRAGSLQLGEDATMSTVEAPRLRKC